MMETDKPRNRRSRWILFGAIIGVSAIAALIVVCVMQPWADPWKDANPSTMDDQQLVKYMKYLVKSSSSDITKDLYIKINTVLDVARNKSHENEAIKEQGFRLVDNTMELYIRVTCEYTSVASLRGAAHFVKNEFPKDIVARRESRSEAEWDKFKKKYQWVELQKEAELREAMALGRNQVYFGTFYLIFAHLNLGTVFDEIDRELNSAKA